MKHIKEIIHIPHLGGGCSVDAVVLTGGKVLTINEDSVLLWRSKEEMEESFTTEKEWDIIGSLELI